MRKLLGYVQSIKDEWTCFKSTLILVQPINGSLKWHIIKSSQMCPKLQENCQHISSLLWLAAVTGCHRTVGINMIVTHMFWKIDLFMK